MTVHYHATLRGVEYVVRDPAGFDKARECACESGELDLYHDACESGEIDESCPCPWCERERTTRFLRWKAEQGKAGVHVQ